MKQFDYKVVEKIIGYEFNNKKLLKQAFFRSSFAHENGRESNEVLEFIGDKVLDYVVVRKLIEKYTKPLKANEYFKSKKSEGELTSIKAELVNYKYLAGCIERLGLDGFIYYGKSDLNNNQINAHSAEEDLLEAIVGAVAIDSSWNINAITKVVDNLLMIDLFLSEYEESTNYIGRVQEAADAMRLGSPEYHLVNQKLDGVMTWVASLSLQGLNQKTQGFGLNQKEARKDAAHKMLPFINAYKQKCKQNLVNLTAIDDVFDKLNSLVQTNTIQKPSYKYEQQYDNDGNSVWTCIATVDGTEYRGVLAPTKKEAQKKAIMTLLVDLARNGII